MINDKTYSPIQTLTFKSSGDIVKNRFVNYSGALCSDDTKSVGVAAINCLSGEIGSVVTIGTAVVETSASITVGSPVTAAANGKARTAVDDDIINGRALNSVSGSGFVTILLVP